MLAGMSLCSWQALAFLALSSTHLVPSDYHYSRASFSVSRFFGFFCVFVALWVLAPKASAHEVFSKFSNFVGWPSTGTACIVRQLTAAAAFVGSDAPVYLLEEVKNASLAVPRMMLATILLNGVLGFVAIVSFVLCITDIDAVVGSTSIFPFVDVFYAGTGSRCGATAMACVPLVLTICTALNAMAAASRKAWSLSRDGGLPFASWFRKVVTIGTPIPLNAIIFLFSILVILALINIGSSTAFNSIVGLLTSATRNGHCELLSGLRSSHCNYNELVGDDLLQEYSQLMPQIMHFAGERSIEGLFSTLEGIRPNSAPVTVSNITDILAPKSRIVLLPVSLTEHQSRCLQASGSR